MKISPLIEKLGLKTHEAGLFISNTAVVGANELESLLSKAQRVTGYHTPTNEWVFGTRQSPHDERIDTHTALLIAVEPIVRGVKKSEIVDMLRCMHSKDPHALADRIEKDGVIDG